ncbi:uncharacterized protein LOC135244531 isoform X2 [Anguilla rostrata]|uniref:uncharacterized protein LOC135244531 isoform X2 n=1 Tax=Anguilla rostrata TaxID=7938 RepID=UPI0030CAEFAB
MLSDRYNNKNYNVTWDGSIGLLDHGDLTVVGKAGQCKMTSTGVPRHQARHAVCDRKVESRPSLATKVPKSKKYVYDKSNQVQNAEYWREMEIQRKVHSQPKAVQEDTEMPALQMHYELCANYECTIRELKLQHNQTLANLKTEMESERILLEEKIGKLKQNMADGIQEKSRNRQKQLQECTNCQSLEMAVEEKALQLIEREKTVEELQRFCRKFCKQLTQQDRLLALMSELHIPK